MRVVVLALALFSLSFAPGCDRPAESDAGGNTVATFLEGAERQSETDDQRREIVRALQDCLALPLDELKSKKYADYQMNPGAWTVVELLSSYFVPRSPTPLDETAFYRDVKAPIAQSAIEEQLDAVKSALGDAAQ